MSCGLAVVLNGGTDEDVEECSRVLMPCIAVVVWPQTAEHVGFSSTRQTLLALRAKRNGRFWASRITGSGILLLIRTACEANLLTDDGVECQEEEGRGSCLGF